MANIARPSNSRYTDFLIAPAMEAVLNSIHELESSSGKNPDAYVEDKFGSYGEYRIRRDTYGDLQKAFPKKYGSKPFLIAMKDPEIARGAAKDYLGLIKSYLVQNNVKPSAGMLLASYNGGMGNTVRGKISPEAIAYANKGLSMTTKQLGVPFNAR